MTRRGELGKNPIKETALSQKGIPEESCMTCRGRGGGAERDESQQEVKDKEAAGILRTAGGGSEDEEEEDSKAEGQSSQGASGSGNTRNSVWMRSVQKA